MARQAVIVTGANRGIGLQLCLMLAGHKGPQNCAEYPPAMEAMPWFDVIVMAGRDITKVETAAESVRAAAVEGVDIRPMQMDVCDTLSVHEFSLRVSAMCELNPIEVRAVVNNAGVLEDSWNEAVLGDAMKTNVCGAMAVIGSLCPMLKANPNGGRIVNVSSGFGMSKMLAPDVHGAIERMATYDEVEKGVPFDSTALERFPKPPGKRLTAMVVPYKITKALLNKVTRLLAADPELVEGNIAVNAVCPGWCDTDMGRMAGTAPPRAADQGASSVLWMLMHPIPSPTGTFTRDGQVQPW